MIKRSLTRPIFGVTLVCLLASCSIRGENVDHVLPSDTYVVNFPTTETTLTPAPTPVSKVGVIIYMIFEDGLLGRSRLIEPTSDPEIVIELLATGPDSYETAAGIRSGLFSEVALITSVGIDGRAIVIDLEKSFADVPGGEQILILGQIVLSLFAFSDIEGVQFTMESQPVSVVGASGKSIDRLITRSDFAILLSM